MKLICLNTWGGKIYKPLMHFIKKHSKDTDIFCFQEVFHASSQRSNPPNFRLNLYNKLSEILKNYQGYFAPSLDNYLILSRSEVQSAKFNLSFGLAIFIKKDIKVNYSGDLFVYRKRGDLNPKNLNTLPRNLQYVTFTKSDKKFIVCNIHGIWQKDGKNDSPSRISQSNQINKFFNKYKGGKILAGDLNLNPETKSIKILEKNMRNLIKEYHVPATRNKYFPGDEKFADYVFVSDGISVIDFQIPSLEVSDHLPMILEFS